MYGGRGASSGNGIKTNLFDEGHKGKVKTIVDLPARMNKMYNGNNMSLEHTLSIFNREHGGSSTEHLIIFEMMDLYIIIIIVVRGQ